MISVVYVKYGPMSYGCDGLVHGATYGYGAGRHGIGVGAPQPKQRPQYGQCVGGITEWYENVQLVGQLVCIDNRL